MLYSNINVDQGLVNGVIIEIVCPLFRHDKIYATVIPSVRIDFGKVGIHLIKLKSMQLSTLQ